MSYSMLVLELSTHSMTYLCHLSYDDLSILQENLQKWLMDEKARDQYVIRAGFDTEVFWNDARQSKPDPVFQKPVSEL